AAPDSSLWQSQSPVATAPLAPVPPRGAHAQSGPSPHVSPLACARPETTTHPLAEKKRAPQTRPASSNEKNAHRLLPPAPHAVHACHPVPDSVPRAPRPLPPPALPHAPPCADQTRGTVVIGWSER